MPPERYHTANPQGRQKSCSECAKAKRRCGLEQPNCARCTRQHLSCVYPPQPRPQTAIPQNATPEEPIDFDITNVALDLQGGSDNHLTFDFDIPTMPTTSTPGILDFDFCTGTNSLESLSNMLQNSTDREDQVVLQRTYAPATKPFTSSHLSSFARSRVEYTIEQMKLAPRMMVEQNCTPWQHPMLYDDHMPRSMQDAYAACAIYRTKNDTNTEHATRYITSRAEDLVNSMVPSDPVDVLARAQALMLYQIMLVFGGDVRLYAQAQALLPHVEDVGKTLLPIADAQTDAAGLLPLYPSAAARSAWKSFIFRESVRRTALSLYHITVVCNLLSGQLTTCLHDLKLNNRITFSAHLWYAKSAFEFAVAWNEKTHFLIKELDFTDVLKSAQPEDLDVFATMMLVGLQGMDDVRGWFYTRGGTL